MTPDPNPRRGSPKSNSSGSPGSGSSSRPGNGSSPDPSPGFGSSSRPGNGSSPNPSPGSGLSLGRRFALVLEEFGRIMPVAESELVYDSPFHLLIAVILSAQCTDKRVNMYTPEIFRKYPAPQDLSEASFEEVFALIKSITFPNNKARHLIGMARMLVEDFSGRVPSDPDELVKLPGVGRKTANVVASVIYDKPVIAVDTHVFRVARRLGLSQGDTVEKVEKDLTDNIPGPLRAKAHHWLLLHGRYVCTSRNPKCGECTLKDLCKTNLK